MKCPRCGKELPDSNVAIVCDGCGYQQNKLTKEDRRRIQQEKLQRLREERKQKSESPKAQKTSGRRPGGKLLWGAAIFLIVAFILGSMVPSSKSKTKLTASSKASTSVDTKSNNESASSKKEAESSAAQSESTAESAKKEENAAFSTETASSSQAVSSSKSTSTSQQSSSSQPAASSNPAPASSSQPTASSQPSAAPAAQPTPAPAQPESVAKSASITQADKNIIRFRTSGGNFNVKVDFQYPDGSTTAKFDLGNCSDGSHDFSPGLSIMDPKGTYTVRLYDDAGTLLTSANFVN